MNSIILLFSLLFLSSFASMLQERQTATYTATTATNSMIRIIQIIETPANAPRFISITSLAAESTQNSFTIDIVQFNLATYNQTTLNFGYFHGTAAQNGQAAAIQEFAFAMRSLVVFEFINNDGIPGFQESTGPNADQMISLYDLSNPALPWNGIVINTTQLVSPGGQTFNVTSISAVTADGVFSFTYTVTEQPILVNGVLITSDQAKIDVAISYYNPGNVPAAWSTGPSNAVQFPNAQIGYAAVTVAGEIFAEFQNGTAQGQNSQLAFGSGNVVGTFSWQPNAMVNVNGVYANGAVYAQVTDVSQNFSAAVFEAFSFKFLFFSFAGNRPSYVYWDPIFGANILYTTASSAFQSTVCLYLTLLAFYVTLF